MLLRFVFLWSVYLGSTFCCEEKRNDLICPSQSEICKCVKKDSSVLCCNIGTEYELKESLHACTGGDQRKVDHVYIWNMTVDTFNVAPWIWENMNSVTISESRIHRFRGKFKGSLGCLSLSSLGLIDVDSDAFVSLKGLHTLDLSNNNLTNIPRISVYGNISINISGNTHIRCSSISDLLDGLQNTSNHINFVNENTTYCLSSKSFNWFNSTDQAPLNQLLLLRKLEQQCPKGSTFKCHCSPFRVDFLPGKFLTYNFKVDCSGQHLTELPLNLPPNTKLLNVSNNKITSLSHLGRPSYEGMREIYADNNQIKSISELEGSSFINNIINNLSVLSLRGNNLTTVPTYFLSNVFKNGRVSNVKLGGNKLHCDCNTAQHLKVWLMTNKEFIPDYEEVLCAADLEKVIFLDQTKLCVYKKEWTDYIYYIIGGEILLLIFLVSKVSYDYWVFKTTGYLPWPASKMPKLPCDWVFES